MPARSNPFQVVVHALQRELAPEARVRESEMLVDKRTGEEREVDVVVRSTTGGWPLVICLECRDHGRPSTVAWVEQMYSKHLDLETNKLILVAKAGFTRSAQAKAAELNIETMQLDPPDLDAAWSRAGSKPRSGADRPSGMS